MKTSLEDKLYLEYPQGFHELDEKEQKRLTFLEEGPTLCLSNPEKHILISISWKRLNRFSAIMLNTPEIAGNMAKQIETGMQPYEFKKLNTVSKTIAGQKAHGIDYEYVAEGKNMAGESLVLKSKKDLYYFHCYVLKELFSESRIIFEKVLETVKIADL